VDWSLAICVRRAASQSFGPEHCLVSPPKGADACACRRWTLHQRVLEQRRFAVTRWGGRWPSSWARFGRGEELGRSDDEYGSLSRARGSRRLRDSRFTWSEADSAAPPSLLPAVRAAGRSLDPAGLRLLPLGRTARHRFTPRARASSPSWTDASLAQRGRRERAGERGRLAVLFRSSSARCSGAPRRERESAGGLFGLAPLVAGGHCWALLAAG